MRTVTLQLFNQGKWWDAATLSFSDEKLSSTCSLSYFPEYIKAVASYDVKDCWACSVNAPISIIPTDYPNWPALLDDILPVSKSREWWLKYLNLSHANDFQQNYGLLTNACMSPVGNIRIKESIPAITQNDIRRFSIDDVIKLQYDFLEYANEHGAAVGGATGAGGVAPKLLLMLEDDKVFIDSDFAGKPVKATPYLTKFARNNRTALDNNILKAEGIFYQALTKVLQGTEVETIDVAKLKILKDTQSGQISLWLPRFDVGIKNGLATRFGLESIYSIINAEPGSFQDHFYVMETVWQKIESVTQMTPCEFAMQYVVRDFLNIVFGNSDNHGRNISFIKLQDDIQFAPIYDFAPMKADPEMVTRLFKWGKNCELGGRVNFLMVCEQLSGFCEQEKLILVLKQLASKLVDLPVLLEKLNCPEEILNFPSIGFKNIKSKLAAMGVYDG
ncbi:HipA domain-containing protein [Glaciecola petra]|uniref:HipA domain-containing protein n=1 Tax=Glaciecola petra TaxID=3075602 RepID=A0ABU2ZL08_9ALTE|nr:HipA domain-containing protein [Aestuariibacter sp. P117]MDT0593305.1 HipA domain-containing protein [Aestuariibacter sp. P117]